MTEVLSDNALVATLSSACRGRLIQADTPDYDTARAVFNAMIDKRPRLIARCLDAADVIAAVNAGREAGLAIAVRGGGHNGPGLGSVDDGLVVDLSEMRGVIVDPEQAVGHVLGGTLLGEVDHATGAFGLVAPFGIISTTGVGGLTLGGGVGNLTRTLGLSIDKVRVPPRRDPERRRRPDALDARPWRRSLRVVPRLHSDGWVQVIVGVDPDPANRELVTDWAVAYSDAVSPYSTGGSYINMTMEEGDDRLRAIYGPNYDRLAEIKAKYDPDNVFHVNQNIKPGV
jgi:FAD/FMN-containing dehydrogenase